MAAGATPPATNRNASGASMESHPMPPVIDATRARDAATIATVAHAQARRAIYAT